MKRGSSVSRLGKSPEMDHGGRKGAPRIRVRSCPVARTSTLVVFFHRALNNWSSDYDTLYSSYPPSKPASLPSPHSVLSESIIPTPGEGTPNTDKERERGRQQAREGNFFFPPRSATDGHLHIGPLIDKHTGGALRNEGPLPSFDVSLSFIFSMWTAIVHC